jgi:uncharacterized delta-60 repeat protein
VNTYKNSIARVLHGTVSVCAALLLSVVTTAGRASPGDVDTSFGNAAQSYFSLTSLGQVQAAAGIPLALPDGKLLMGGACRTATVTQFTMCVGRLNANGTVDSTFGSSGATVLTNVGYIQSFTTAIARLADGKIIVAGACTSTTNVQGLCAYRLFADGSVDTGYGNNGLATTFFSGRTPFTVHLSAQADGKVVLATSCTGQAICIARFTASGTLDSSFAGPGQWVMLAGQINSLSGITQRPSGEIVLASQCIVSGGFRACVQQLLPNGAPDSSFAGGNLVLATSANSGGRHLALQPDGMLVLLAACANGSVSTFCLFRFDANGNDDATFGFLGAATLAISTFGDQPQSVLLQPDGKIVAVGNCRLSNTAFDDSFCLARFMQNGRLDVSFGPSASAGRVVVPRGALAGLSNPARAILQYDEKIVIANVCGSIACVVRLQGGPFGARRCSLDVDGDNVGATGNDVLLATRAAMGFTGANVLQGTSFAPHATRTNWAAIRDYLFVHCGMTHLQP